MDDLCRQNPKDFVAPFELFEFASHAKTEKAQLVLCCMNWLVSEPPEDSGEPANNPPNNPPKPVDEWENVKDTLSYWALRMHPMMGSNAIFVGCNRVGTERGTTFTGSSCIMKLGEHPLVYEHASKTGEQVIMASVDMPSTMP